MCTPLSPGIHGVMVRIRDDDLKTMPGVRVEDMG
jgi:acyl-CoA oxidase